MKLVKKLVKLVLWIVGIAAALVLALPLWVGPAVKTAANAIVPKKTGTGFNLGAFALNPYTGKLAVGDVQLFNPEGFDQKMAVTLGSLDVDVDVASLAGDPIVVREISLKDVFVSYVMNMKGESNFAIIQKNAAGGEEPEAKAEGEGAKAKGEGEARSDKLETSQTSQTSKKVVIDRLLIRNVVVQLGPISVPNPVDIELTGIGRKSNGVTMAEAWEQIYAQVVQNLGALGVNVNGLVGDLGNAGLEQAVKAIDAAGDLSKKEGREKAVRNLVDAFAGGAGVVGDSAGKTTDAVGAGTKKAADAVGESTGKAVNALKGLFK